MNTFKTYFVETRVYNGYTNDLDLLEYFKYESGVYNSPNRSKIEDGVHHTILALVVF